MKTHILSLLLLAPFASLCALEPIPAFKPGTRILFQGDSITDGNRGRSADPNHILGHGYVFIIAARHGAAFPEAKLEFMNRGVSGNTVLELEKRWDKETLELKARLNAIMAKHTGQPVEQIEKDLERDNFKSAHEAVEYGLIDTVLAQRKDMTGGAKS